MGKKSVTVIFYVLSAALAVLCVCTPGGSVALLPLLCVLLYFLSPGRKAWVLAAAAAVYAGAGTLFHGLSVTYVGGAAAIVVLALPAALKGKLPFWGEISLCAGVCAAAVCSVLGIWALACHCGITDVITGEIASLTADPLAGWLASREYAGMTEERLGHAHLSATDPGYAAESLEVLGRVVAWELDGNLLWYITGFGAFAGGLACAGDRALTAAFKRPQQIKPRDIRLGRKYLLEIGVPVVVFAFTAFYEPMQPVVRTVVNLMITLPTALCGYTLLYHTLMRIGGKAKIAAVVAFWAVVALSAVFYEWALLIAGFVGLADAIIDVRALLDKALE